MISIVLNLIIFIIIFAGAVLGMMFRKILPDRHLDEDSKNMVVLGMGVVATMAAITLGFMIEGARDSFRNQRNDLIEISAKVILLDRLLADYGPETGVARDRLRISLAKTISHFWPKDGGEAAALNTLNDKVTVYGEILSLEPKTGRENSIRDEALSLAFELSEERNTLVMTQVRVIPGAFIITLCLLVFWFVAIFFSFGLYAPANATVISTLLIAALSVTIALFLIMELNRPYDGLLRMPSGPLVEALQQIGK